MPPREILLVARCQREVVHGKRTRRTATLHGNLREHGRADCRLRVLHLLPGDTAVVVGVDEHSPCDVLHRQVPTELDWPIGLGQLQRQVAGTRGVRASGLPAR